MPYITQDDLEHLNATIRALQPDEPMAQELTEMTTRSMEIIVATKADTKIPLHLQEQISILQALEAEVELYNHQRKRYEDIAGLRYVSEVDQYSALASAAFFRTRAAMASETYQARRELLRQAYPDFDAVKAELTKHAAPEPPECDICRDMLQESSGRESLSAPEDEEIRELCERQGYGAVLDAAARLWRRKDPIGAKVVGPCIGVLQGPEENRRQRAQRNDEITPFSDAETVPCGTQTQAPNHE